MNFNSIHFAVFFVAVYSLYLLLPTKRAQNVMLLCASYYFYGQWSWTLSTLLWWSTGLDFYCAKKIEAGRGTPTAKRFFLLSIISNLALLGFFKYCDFFISSLADLLHAVGLSVELRTLGIVVPVGISFYTFQTMSYVIDVYRGRLQATDSLLDFALFVAFFPHLVAGPIVPAKDLLPQLSAPREVTIRKITSGVQEIFWGLFKKVVIADNLAHQVVDPIFDRSLHFTGSFILLGMYGFAFQIYCDFSGYSSIARGVARCMGVELSLNFRFPYFSQNPQEFWTRWHITLSSWLRDYLYIPLGGSRLGHTYRNLMLTMLLGGLWHGAQWKFVAWGLYQGGLLVAHRWWRSIRPAPEGQRHRLLNMFVMFHLACLGWLIFRATSLSDAVSMFTGMIAEFPIFDYDFTYTKNLLIYVGPLLLIDALDFWRTEGPEPKAAPRFPAPVRVLAYAVGFYMIVILGDARGKEFIYFQF